VDAVTDKSDSPGVIALPPLLYGGTFLVGLALHLLWPVHLLSAVPARVAGAVFVLASGVIARWAERAMQRAGTNILPTRPTTTIVSDGPYQFTRNPLYVASTGLFIGLTLLLNSLWPLLLLPPLLALVEWGVIRREERYLERKFGDAYLAYKSRVRRWL